MENKQQEKQQEKSWAEMSGDSDHLEKEQVVTASFLVTCRQAEGGNRMLDVKDPLFHCRSETLRPWEVPGEKGTRGPKARL